MKNYKLIIQYDGSCYAGWQIQKNALTVQQLVTEKIETVLRTQNLKITGSGRTDAGVHALGQTANFQFENIPDLRKFSHSLNALLPEDICVTSVNEVDLDFHSRFSAKKRSYFYLLNSVKSPFYNKYSWLDSRFENLDLKRMNEISAILKGSNDFTSFCKKSAEVENRVCNIFNLHWYKKGRLTLMYIEADRFLHGMVRTITGTLLKAANESEPGKFLTDILSAKDREAASEAAPAKGLFLYKVKY